MESILHAEPSVNNTNNTTTVVTETQGRERFCKLKDDQRSLIKFSGDHSVLGQCLSQFLY